MRPRGVDENLLAVQDKKKGEWGFQSRLSPPSPGRRRKHVVKGDSLKRNIRIYDDSSLSA